MKEQLERLEKQIEALVEGSLARLLGGGMSASDVAAKLARAMCDGVRVDDKGKAHAPDQYALALNPEDSAILSEMAPDINLHLGKGLLEAARNAGYLLRREPHITLAADPTLFRHQLRAVAWHSTGPLDFTQAMPQASQIGPIKLPLGAFLIIEGKRHVPLDRPVMNIGRRLENQIVIEDPRISRSHAQLRLREGRYVLFDLGSTSGTQVNGRPVKQHVLLPGDVISLGPVRLVYGEDPGGGSDTTPAFQSPFPDRPAADEPTPSRGWDEEPVP